MRSSRARTWSYRGGSRAPLGAGGAAGSTGAAAMGGWTAGEAVAVVAVASVAAAGAAVGPWSGALAAGGAAPAASLQSAACAMYALWESGAGATCCWVTLRGDSCAARSTAQKPSSVRAR